jgi:hypothetical protein
MSYLVSIMLTCQQKEFNVIERSECNCSHPTWKSISHTMATKVSQIAAWVFGRSEI